MGYIRKTYRCRHGIQVEEYHNFRRRPPGEKRQARKKQTPEKVRENNQRRKKQKVQRMMLEYFDEGDKYITLTYEDKPDLEQVQKDMKRLMEYMKPRYKKAGIELMWIRNIERTKRGVYHIHLLIKNIPDIDVGKLVREYWKERQGKIARVEDAYLDGGFERLAAYMTKTERDEEGKALSSFSHSRNMPDVVPTVKEYVRNVRKDGEWREIRVAKGYAVLKDSVYEGINEITGFPYRRYTLIKLEDSGGCRHTFT